MLHESERCHHCGRYILQKFEPVFMADGLTIPGAHVFPGFLLPSLNRFERYKDRMFSGWLVHSAYIGIWLVVSTPLKKISQLGWFFPIYGKIKNVPNHQSVYKHQPYAFQTVAMWGTYFQLGTRHKTIPHDRPYMTNIKRRGCVRDPTHISG